MLAKHLEKRQRVLIILEPLTRQTNKLIVRVVDFRKKPIQNVTVKVFKIEKEPMTPAKWVENLKNGFQFKRLVFSMNTDDNGSVTAELPQGTHEAKVEEYSLIKFAS